MRNLMLIVSLGLCLSAITTHAGQAGYLLNGKKVITHKDGEALKQKDGENSSTKAEKPSREPASALKMQGTLNFEEDDLARCYWRTQESGIHCIKK